MRVPFYVFFNYNIISRYLYSNINEVCTAFQALLFNISQKVFRQDAESTLRRVAAFIRVNECLKDTRQLSHHFWLVIFTCMNSLFFLIKTWTLCSIYVSVTLVIWIYLLSSLTSLWVIIYGDWIGSLNLTDILYVLHCATSNLR